MNPTSFDLYEQWSNSINVLWRSRYSAHREETPSVLGRNKRFNKTGKLTENARMGAGDAPHKIINIQDDGTLKLY